MLKDVFIKKLEYGSKEYNLAFELRNTVLRAPKGKNLHDEDLPKEKISLHFGAYYDSQLVGAATFWREGNVIILKHIVISGSMQGFGVGKKLLDCIENYCVNDGVLKIKLRARVTAIGFYKKCDYIMCVTEPKTDDEHVWMEKIL